MRARHRGAASTDRASLRGRPSSAARARSTSARDGALDGVDGLVLGPGDRTRRVGPTHFDVYVLSEEQVDETCGLGIDDVYACAFVEEPNPVVVTSYVPTEHELVHAYASLKQDGPKRRYAFLEEGFASVYARDGRLSEARTSLVEGLSFARLLPVDHYPRAAHFMNFVIDEFGAAATTRMLLASADARDLDALDSTFVETLGISTEALPELYEQESVSRSSAGWQRGYDCEATPEEWHFPGTLRLDIAHACNSPMALGSSSGPTFERFTLDFPEPTIVSIHMDTPAEEQHPNIRLTKCGACDDELSFEHELSRPLFGLELEPRTYVVRTLYSSGQPEPGVLVFRQH